MAISENLSGLDMFYAALITLLLLGAEVAGEVLIEDYVKSGRTWSIVGGVSIYFTVPFFFWALLHVLGEDRLTVANTIWQALNIASVALIAYFLLGESANWLQWTGVGLAIVAVALVAIPSQTNMKMTRYNS